MSISSHTVLVTTRDIYDAEGDPPSVQAIAERMDTTTETVRPLLDSLCRCELLSRLEGGYRPTVTARELLGRGIHLDGVAAVDVVEEE